MYKYLIAILLCLVSLSLYAATPQENAQAGNTAPATAPGLPHFANENMRGRIYGTVLESMDAGAYTYIHLDTGTKKVWAASPRTTVKRGSMVAVGTEMPMTNFHSKALNRDFELIYFTDRITRDSLDDSYAAAPDPHENIAGKPSNTPVKGIQKAEDGKTIAEILDQKQALAGQSIRVRGKVVKYSTRVLGKNWIHIRDSSIGKDLTITTDGTVKIGDIILANGKLILDKDFGYGYVYEVLLEDSTVTVE
ncbi:MAG: hypothetical protein BMS9Abin09_0621 [Gammaproteobacteria bacterium]|nr:MAG: hypothetical protein BMS9Abin09_0621 [Gammaproteobacteria bacterium]